jgi:hypothetical protein
VRTQLGAVAIAAVCAAGVALLVSTDLVGQSQPGAARAGIARTADGHPDLQGVWQALNTAIWNIQDHPASWGVPAGQGVVEGNELPYLPEALKRWGCRASPTCRTRSRSCRRRSR